jgi:hypothetical protein
MITEKLKKLVMKFVAKAPAKSPAPVVLNQSNVKCYVFTFKEGVLSLFAHDLKLQVFKFQIVVESSVKGQQLWGQVSATFDAASIRPLCAINDGDDSPYILSQSDSKDIQNKIASCVLQSREFPLVRFQSESFSGSPDNFLIKGNLTLRDVTRKISVCVKRSKDICIAETTLDQLSFGIKPFSALMGAMKIKPEVKIRLEMKN